MSAGVSLRKLRQDFGLTRAEVVAEADMGSETYLKYIEDERIDPTKLTIHNVTAAIVRAHTKKTAAGATATAETETPTRENRSK